jgi:hypothetical protein
MFPNTYFARHYFAPRYFPRNGGAIITPATPQDGGGVVRMSPRIKPPVLFDDEDALILMLMEILANE